MKRRLMYHCVYRITHLLDWRAYIGKHSGNISPELDVGKLGGYFSSSQDVNFMLDQKINPQNYKYEILRTFETSEAAIDYEIYLHAKHDVGVNSRFYNKAKQISSGFDVTGIPSSEEKKANLRTFIGSKNSRSKPVIQVNPTNGNFIKEWESARQAGIGTGGNSNSITLVARGLNKTSGGYGWIYKEDYNPYAILDRSYNRDGSLHPNSKQVIQINSKGNIKKVWGCIKDAVPTSSVGYEMISRCVRGKAKTAADCNWIAVEDLDKYPEIKIKYQEFIKSN